MNNPDTEWKSAYQAAPAGNSDGEFDLTELIGVLWRGKFLIALFAALGILLTLLYLSQATSLYTARATLILDAQEQKVVDLESVAGGISSEDTELFSQIQVIESRKLIGEVVDELGLAEDPEFVPLLREASIPQKAVGAFKRFVSGMIFSPTTNSLPQKQTPRELAIDDLTRKLVVSIIPKTFVFQVSLETRSPEKSAKIVNHVADTYIEQQIATKVDTTSQAAIWLAKQVEDLGRDLESVETKVADYRRNTERSVSEEDVAASNQNLKTARGRLNTLLIEYGPEGPITEREKTTYANLQRTITELESIVSKQYEDLLKLRQLDREASAARAIYEYFLQRLNEIEVQKGIQEANVRILSKAIPRYARTSPRATFAILIGLLVGALVGAGYTIVRKLMDRAFTDPAELQKTFGLPVLGVVPHAPTKNRHKLLSYAMNKPSSQFMEAIRSLRTSLMMSKLNGDHKILMTTSSVPGEGKTTGAVLLAVNTVALKKNVLLIECDLRRSTFQNYFKRQSKLGLLSALESEEAAEQAISRDDVTGVDVLFAERSKVNAADVFASKQFGDFMGRMKEKYDLVILDVPPVLPVPDARLIAKYADAVLYSIHAGSTQASLIEAGLGMFKNVNIPVDGLVLTQVKRGMGYGYGGYRYGYGYGYGSSGYYSN